MLGRALAAAVLLTPIPFADVMQAAALPPSAGSNITVQGKLKVYSGLEFPFGTAYAHYQDFSHVFAMRAGEHVAKSWSTEACAGGDTRGWVRFTVRRTTSGTIEAKALLRLFEGTRCSTAPLEKQKGLPFSQVTSQPRNFVLTLYNRPDQTWVTFNVASKFKLCCV